MCPRFVIHASLPLGAGGLDLWLWHSLKIFSLFSSMLMDISDSIFYRCYVGIDFWLVKIIQQLRFEPSHDKTNKINVRPAKTQISLIRVFAVRMKKAWVLSYPLSAQRRLWSDWADAQADLSLRWAHSHFVGFVMSRLNCIGYQFLVPFLSHPLNIKLPSMLWSDWP